jgi:tetratricopeptide (TPR) repeat protein
VVNALTKLAFLLPVAWFLFGGTTQASAGADERQYLVQRTVERLFQRVVELYKQGKYQEAIPLAQQVLRLDQQEFGNESVETATGLNNLAEFYRLSGDYTKAEPLCSEALRIRRKILGNEALDTAQSLNQLAQIYQAEGNYAKAQPLFSQALQIRQDYLGPEDPDTVQTLSNLALVYQATGDFSKAEALSIQALQIREKVLGLDNPDTAISRNNLAFLYSAMGDYKKAEPLYQQSLQILQKALGPEHPLVATNLNNLGGLYYQMGDYSRAQPLLERALQIRQKVLGPENPDTAATMNELGETVRATGKYSEGKALFEQALQIMQKSLGQENSSTAVVLNNLGGVYADMGDDAKAESVLKQVLEIQRKLLGREHVDTALILNNLGDIYRMTGQFEKAESMFNQALQIMEKRLGPTHPKIAQSLNNLGNLYLSMGNYEKAEPLFNRALQIRQSVDGPEHPDTAQTLNSLGTLYQRIGDYGRAVPLFQRALQIRQKVFGTEHLDTADSLNNLAMCYYAASNYDSAKPLFEEALRIAQKLFGNEHRETATGLNNLAEYYMAVGDYAKAEPLVQQSLQIDEKVLGRDHPNTAMPVNNLAYLKLDLNKPDEAKLLAERSYESSLGTLSKILAFTSEQQRLAYEAGQMPYTLFASLKGSDALLADAVIHYKGVVLDSIIEDRRLAENALDKASIERLDADKTQLGRLLLQSSSQVSSDTEQTIQKLEQEVDRIEGQLAQQLTASHGTRRALAVTLGQVQAAIPKDGALIEYVRFPYYLGKNRFEFRYGAVLLSSKGDPHWILLGNADDIDAAVNQVKALSASRGADDKELTANLRKLYESVFAPLEQILPPQSLRMIVCPDGQLNFLSFATLLDSQSRFLAERYTVEYVASGRDLLSQSRASANSNAVVFANPDFDLAGAKMTAQIDPLSPSVRSDNFRGGEQRDLTENAFSPLQGTQQESDELTKKFREWDWQVAAFTGEQATKEALLKRVHSPCILHVATHGFFDRQAPASNRSPSNTLLGQVQPNVGTSKFFDNPMHRSGLALAGAQTTLRAWERGETLPREDDGILTAEDVATLDLQGTWLVTLSACDTGSGQARVGEGVLGLRRGFIEAGAQNLLMTLWPISDQFTVQIMSDFYEAAHKTGNAPNALAEVQRDWLLKLRTEKGLATAVKIAGPFIMSSQGKP